MYKSVGRGGSPDIYAALKNYGLSQYYNREIFFWEKYIALIYASLKQMLGKLILIELIYKFLFIISVVTQSQRVFLVLR